MKSLRVWLGLALSWILITGSFQHLASSVSLMCAMLVLLTLVLLPPIARIPPQWLALPVIAALLLTKRALGYPLTGTGMTQTVLDVAAVLITTLLAARAGRSINDFYAALAKVALPASTACPRPFSSVQSKLFREVRRARQNHQPLTLLALSASATDEQLLRDRFTEESLQALAGRNTLGRLAAFLREQVRNCETIALRDDHLIAILPSTTTEEADKIAKQLQSDARSALGLEIQIGKSSFPDEELTFFGLLNKAEANRRTGVQEIPETAVSTAPATEVADMVQRIYSRLPTRVAELTSVSEKEKRALTKN